MIEIELDLVVAVAGALVAGELELFDEVFVRYLGEPPALVGIEVDVIDEERSGGEGADTDGGGVGGPGGPCVGGGSGPVCVTHVIKFEVNLNLVVLYLYTLPLGIFLREWTVP